MSNTFTAQGLSDFYQKVADGGEIEYQSTNDSWSHKDIGPNLLGSLDNWRIKPTKKVIDLSVLIESGIDCEFQSRSTAYWVVGKLRHQVSGSKRPTYHIHRGNQGFAKCQPRMNHKHAWQGGDCPLPEGFEVQLWDRYGRDAVRTTASGNGLEWHNFNPMSSDIIAFEVLGLADGYVMPWEQDND